MWWLYQAVYALLLATAGPPLLLFRGRHYLPSLAARLGLGGKGRMERPRPGGLWIHAVSVGEVAVGATLARALPPELPLTMTTITPTGQERAKKALAGRVAVGYLPFELGPLVRRTFDATAARALVLVEGDYWPIVLREANRRRVPVVVVNGRVSDRSFPRLRLARRLVRPLLLDRVERFGVQTALDRDRLVALGVDAARVEVTGNLKFEAPDPAPAPELAARFERLAAGRPILLAGSTMPGEEEKLLAALEAAGGPSAALLVAAPRHPERFDGVFARLDARYPGASRRSDPVDPPAPPTVVLLDTIGELAALYAVARAAFVGGTLVRTGGHNPIEAARFGVPVVAGGSMNNFREIADSFDRAGAWARVANVAELGRLWQRWLLDPGSAAEIGRKGRDLVEANRGALARTLELLAPYLPSAS